MILNASDPTQRRDTEHWRPVPDILCDAYRRGAVQGMVT